MRKTAIPLLLTICFIISLTIFPVHAGSSPAVPELPEIQAESYILINGADNRVLCEKNSHQKQYPASTTKIMTAIITLEAGYYEQTTTVSKAAVDGIGIGGSNMGLKEGEVLTYKDLLNMTLISSANDAANALAEGVGGSIPGFADLMNQRSGNSDCQIPASRIHRGWMWKTDTSTIRPPRGTWPKSCAMLPAIICSGRSSA